MINFLIGGMFGFIFAWLWWHWLFARRAGQDSVQYNRTPAVTAHSAETVSAASDAAEWQRLQTELNTREQRVFALQRTVDAQTTELKGLQRQLERSYQDKDARIGELNAARAEMDTLREQLAAQERAVADLESRLKEFESKAAPAQSEQAEHRRLQTELASCNERSQTLQTELKSCSERSQTLQTELASCNERSQALQTELQSSNERSQALQTELATKTDALADAVADLDTKAEIITNLQTELEAARAARTAADAADDEEEIDIDALKASLPQATTEPDDLKKIKGIASVIEGLLNDLGITTFRQITLLSPTQVSQVSRALKTFPDRMYRDRWMEQAREFHKEKYGEDI